MKINPGDRFLFMFVVILFLVGVWMTYIEVRKWIRERRERSVEPLFVNQLGERIQQAQVIILDRFSSIRRRLEQSLSGVEANTKDDQPKKAA
jgi:hypothetical protein